MRCQQISAQTGIIWSAATPGIWASSIMKTARSKCTKGPSTDFRNILQTEMNMKSIPVIRSLVSSHWHEHLLEYNERRATGNVD